jgi:hypothetical protein
MAPRSGQDVSFKSILLKANGNVFSWSYRWALNWSYTFWRPGAPAFPLSTESERLEANGRTVTGGPVRGEKNGAALAPPDTKKAPGTAPAVTPPAPYPGQGATDGDSITIDRQSKTITVVIR